MGQLIETCGLYGSSRVQVLQLSDDSTTFAPTLVTVFDPGHYVQGVTALNANSLLALTWRERLLLTIDSLTLAVSPSAALFPSGVREGWGLTSDGANFFFITDGT